MKDPIIYLDRQHNTYYAGQTVNGRIEYVFDSPKKVRGIHIKIKGEAHTEWCESKEEQDAEGKTQSSDILHTGNEEYFQISYYLLGSSTGNEIELPAGKQVYNFTCALPSMLPSSFEGKYGYIRYTVKVTMDRPWNIDQETKMAFTVINELDLNLNPSYQEPIHFQLEKTFCCFCCASPPLCVDVRAPVSGYCPGQAIPFVIDIENKSNVQLDLVKITLRQVVNFRVSSPSNSTRKTKDVVLTLQVGPAPERSTRNYSLAMEIPPLPPSNLVNCTIIDLDYDLKLECVVSGTHLNLKDRKYITIGTVPLVNAGQLISTPSAPMQPSNDTNQPAVLPVGPGEPAVLPVGPGEPAVPSNIPAGDVVPGGWVVPGAQPPPPYQSLYPTLSQPVYRESKYAARTIQDRGESENMAIIGRVDFSPRYPTYEYQPPPLPE